MGMRVFVTGIILTTSLSFVAIADELTPGKVSALKERMEFWRANAPRCAGPSGFPFPSGEQMAGGVACEDGDMVLFNGLLCASGEAEGCEMVRRSQITAVGDDQGRWFRSPRRLELGNDHDRDGKIDDEVGGEDADGDGRIAEQELDSFSFDMSIGVMLTLARARSGRDVDAATADSAKVSGQLWWDYLASFTPKRCQRIPINLPPPLGKPCIVPSKEGVVGVFEFLSPICPDCAEFVQAKVPIKFLANHWAFIVRPGDYALFGELQRFLGLNASDGDFRDGIEEFLGQASDHIVLAARMNDDGYPEHLTASSILLMRLMRQENSKLDLAADVLACVKEGRSLPKEGLSPLERLALDPDMCIKEAPLNPFFTYLSDGPSDRLVDELLAACPAPDRMPGPNSRYQWMWEKETAHRSWERSMYWDCIFLGNLLIAS
jgi:hypothetical protein